MGKLEIDDRDRNYGVINQFPEPSELHCHVAKLNKKTLYTKSAHQTSLLW